jgi:predicted transcriptional regulator
MGVRVTVELDESILAKLDLLAADTNRSRDLLVREAVDGFVAYEEAIVAKIKEGIAQADRDEFATEEELDEIEREIEALIPKSQ